MNDENLYAKDENHPIPDIDVVDVNTVKKGGGSDLFIVIASPLSDDTRSLRRLLRKIERYLEFIQTDAFLMESGVASSANTNVIVKIHRDSSPEAFELLSRSRPWVLDNSADLIVDKNL